MPAQSDALADAVGVDSHFNYWTSPYHTAYQAVSSALISSGIRHIRDGYVNYVGPNSAIATITAAGIRHGVGFNTGVTASQVTALVSAQASAIDYVEPTNEADSGAKSTAWVAPLLAEQQVIYKAMRSNPAFANIPVLGPSMASQVHYANLGNMNPVSDLGNLHNATCNQNPGTSSNLGIPTMTRLIRVSTTKPIWTTETGYGDDLSRPCAIPDQVIAKYDPRTVVERFIAGEPRVYFYQLADMPSDPVFGSMGLLDSAGNPKPQFTSIASLVRLVSDKGSSFSPVPLSYKITGSTQNLQHLLLQKRDGTYLLLLWLEVPGWSGSPNNIGGTAVSVAPQTVTISTAQSHATANMFKYSPSWSFAESSLPAGTNSYTFPVGDTIEVLELK
jgi:hypothetical protein